MKDFYRNIFHLSCFIIAFLMVSGCEEKLQPSVTSNGPPRDIPSQESWNAKIVFSDSGRISAILHAGHIAVYDDRRYTTLDSNITVDFYDENAKHTSILTARRGRVNDITHDFEAYENVVVVSDSGGTLRTEELFWDNGRALIHTEKFVDITSPTEHIQGMGLESDQNLKHYTIKHVTGQAITNQ
ncbi:MAG: LPS export ABC transporter periplasmic protein LptC [Bacteroidota bacterium]